MMKMDVEHSEWPTLDTALRDDSLNNVTQFLFETHNRDESKDGIVKRLKILQGLRNRGFRIFYAHKNPTTKIGNNKDIPLRVPCYELHTIHIPSCRVV